LEGALDAGGVARKWFELVSKAAFDADMGLWQSTAVEQMYMDINAASGKCETAPQASKSLLVYCPERPEYISTGYFCEDHLVSYRFLGRLMDKALFDGQLVVGHLSRYPYKHILDWPITFDDLDMLDKEYFTNLKQLETMAEHGDNIETLCLTFTATQDIASTMEEVELVEGGADIAVTNINLPEYLEACLKYRVLDRVKPQLNELLLGVYDVIPEPLLTVFDFQELELLVCGLPHIDLTDWK
jgi:hypothetical protein